ncbi:GerAB/ArcD/ProY family transporter [Lysinibacillus piscis]|uniref:Uncharacterized protein n=1 Tax=Lysinibacillus piscis TaxID=2518931 RepID=A0ABQ5NL00_9BACI|nr:endospore germination permease [Lysinibacillus sp. KH24]GLC89034.1 hypothetical protein LYSBPC_21610 [Lysinibacillus sp. KH24]
MNKEMISSRQFTIITLLCSIGTAILIIPASITNDVQQDAWIVASIGVIFSLLIIKLFITLGKRTPSFTFPQAIEKIVGKFFGKAINLCFTMLMLLSAGELLYFIGIFMKTEIMPETPSMSFVLLFGIIVMYAAYLGIEVFARSAEILFPVFAFIFIVFVLCISPQIDIGNVQPILEASPSSMVFSTIRFMSLFSFPLVILLIVFPSNVDVQESATKGFYIGAMIGGVVLVTVILLSILVLGPTLTSSRTFPSYALAQRISIGDFLQRIEVIMAAMWITTIYIRMFMYFYASVISMAQVFNIANHRPLIIPLGMISMGLSQVIHPTIIESNLYNQEYWPILATIFMVLLPLMLLIIAMLRHIKAPSN